MKNWDKNLTSVENGIFRTMNGNADEMIAIGRIIKAGFPCSRVDVTNAKYDAIVDIVVDGESKLLRIQIKGTGGNSINFTGGYRSGKQIDRQAESRKYKYTKKDCDLIVGIDTDIGECYIIPVDDIQQWRDSKSLNALQHYKENWQIIIDEARKK
jgi:hypothetical protein